MVLKTMPTISLAELANGQPLSLVSLLWEAALDVGFFELDARKADLAFPHRGQVEYLRNELLEEWNRFAALPLEVKMEYYDAEGGGERGYIPVGGEQSGFAGGRKASVFEWREQFAIGPSLDDSDPRADYDPLFYRRNIVGKHSDRLVRLGNALLETLDEQHVHVYDAYSRALGLPEEFLGYAMVGGNKILRINHCPALDGEVVSSDFVDGMRTLHVRFRKPEPVYDARTGAWGTVQEIQHLARADRHTDIACLTFLLGATKPGLMIQQRNGDVAGFTSIDGHRVVNAGDILQHLSGGLFVSSPHWVEADEETIYEPRTSITEFDHPRPLYALLVPHNLQVQGKAYSAEFAGLSGMRRFKEIGLISEQAYQERARQINELSQRITDDDTVQRILKDGPPPLKRLMERYVTD